MRGDDLDLAVDGTTLGELKTSAGFEKGVKAIENRRTAAVGVFDEEPVAILHRLNERSVDPLEASGAGSRLGSRDGGVDLAGELVDGGGGGKTDECLKEGLADGSDLELGGFRTETKANLVDVLQSGVDARRRLSAKLLSGGLLK
jgi:hypothetical protein